MNCRELITFLETEVPLETAEGWDNPGFLVGDKDKEIKKVLVVLDITNEVVDYAIDQKADFILAHHPIIFSKINKCTSDDFLQKKLLKLIRHDICAYGMHTCYDVCRMGDQVADRLNLKEIQGPVELSKSHNEKAFGKGIGIVAKIEDEISVGEYAKKVKEAFDLAAERFAAVNVDVNSALEKLQKISLSLHCWQADDVTGFENPDGSLSGGIQVTGNYPGKARNIDEVRADILTANSFIPGTHRLNLHEIYGDFGGKKVDRDEVEPAHFQSWMEWGKENNMKLDFNSTSFSHPKSGNLTLANPDDSIRNFWIEHTKRCRAISEAMGVYQNDPCMMNLWIHDGSKEVPASRIKYRQLLKDSLDEIFATEYKNMKDCIEAKLFGIGLESYTVGSYDFYLGYGAKNNKIVTLDTGHFHLTESIADKISSMLLFTPEIMLHVSRPIRWDSDHVVVLSDDLLDLSREIIRCNALDRVHIGLDYFDATINRIGAYVIGCRATLKAFLQALLEPSATLQQYESEDKLFQRLALQEELKSLPWTAVWDMYCLKNNVPVGEDYIAEIEKYEAEVTSKRK